MPKKKRDPENHDLGIASCPICEEAFIFAHKVNAWGQVTHKLKPYQPPRAEERENPIPELWLSHPPQVFEKEEEFLQTANNFIKGWKNWGHAELRKEKEVVLEEVIGKSNGEDFLK